jgi:hypothetical protein
MNREPRRITLFLTPLTLLAASLPASGLDIVRDGQPVATIVVAPDETGSATAPRKRPRRGSPSDRMAAEVLVDWVRKITDAELPITDTAPPRGPAILVGRAAIETGMGLDDIDSPSNEGLRVRCDGRRRVLLAGQDSTATVKAACRLLEEWGCRYFVDHEIGEVHPRQKTLTLGRLDITEKPGFPASPRDTRGVTTFPRICSRSTRSTSV